VVKQVLGGSSERVGSKQQIAGSLNSVTSSEQQEITTLCFSSATKYCQKIMIFSLVLNGSRIESLGRMAHTVTRRTAGQKVPGSILVSITKGAKLER
jgi:hypothetical protein